MTTHLLPMKGEIYLRMIKSEEKTHEGRIYGPACRKMQVGDRLKVFDNRAGWGIICEITGMDVYYSFDEMLREKGALNMLPQLKGRCQHLTADQT